MGVRRGRQWRRKVVLAKAIHGLLVRYPKEVRRAKPPWLRQRGGKQMLDAVVKLPLPHSHFW